ncbi:MAG TPA: hypothetical protein VK614_13710 [Allosphingosinicella sp.]|nr:hypothetical protein [Allosphingosinicella sp.]
MDIEQERQKLKAITSRIQDAAVRSELEAKFEELAGRHAGTEDKAAVEAEIGELQQRAAQAAQATPVIKLPGNGGEGGGGGRPLTCPDASPAALLTGGGYFLVILLIIGAFAFVCFYFRLDHYPSIEETRPLLVLTLIVCMLGFGGLMIVRALFAPLCMSGDELQNRFRLAREVFLVFSGIFGTIIGFYFGSADGQAAATPRVQVAVARERQITATVEGGNTPFLGILTLANQTGGTTMTVNQRTLSLNLPAAPCPRDATITVVDGLGRRAEAKITQTNEVLVAAGWSSCTGGTPPVPPATNATDAGNATGPGNGQ